jgi:hypothetical protein
MTTYQGVKQDFRFELYSENSCTESGAPVTDVVHVEMRGADLNVTDILARFQEFLMACGYASTFVEKRIDLVDIYK